ncbi:unnamed protein product [Peronospora destructor]|uniref:Uncharacterized protein n=1 Tax=Peronospora destructor TaxID=86335 RepID=A0AAV0UMF5_9STRA|nr:unnamed protein product [Peronospora destructor]
MKTVANVSTDDLVNSLLRSVTTTNTLNGVNSTTKPLELTASSSSSTSSSDSQSENPSSQEEDSDLSPVTNNASSLPPSPTSVSPPTAREVTGTTSDDKDSGVMLSIAITVGILLLVVAALFFLRSQRKRPPKKRNSVITPPAGVTSMTVPVHRGFKDERNLGMPEMSIELSPGDLGTFKSFDVSCVSSARTSTASNQRFDNSNVSSTDSSVFNTRGGLSPTLSNRKMNSYSYHYRESEENGNVHANPHLATTSTMFHLTGLIGNGQASGRSNNASLLRIPAGRKLSAPDEYAELVTATNAHTEMDMDSYIQSSKQHAGFAQSTTNQDEMDRSMGPDDDHSLLPPLPTRAAMAPTRVAITPTRAVLTPTRSKPMVARASEESMGPDSPVKMSTLLRSSDDDPNAMSTASFLSESSISSVSTRDSFATTAHGSALRTPALTRCVLVLLIALNPEKAKGSSSEIAI